MFLSTHTLFRLDILFVPCVMMLLSPGRQRRTELHGEAADRDRPQQGAPDGRHRPDPGPARRHQHEARQVIDNRDRPSIVAKIEDP